MLRNMYKVIIYLNIYYIYIYIYSCLDDFLENHKSHKVSFICKQYLKIYLDYIE